jgi:hypothetical protein
MRYQIELDAPISEEVLAAFPELVPAEGAGGSTAGGVTLIGDLVDQAHLQTILGRIETLGLGLAGLNRLAG